MGHAIFLQSHIQGGSQNITTSKVLACFSQFITYREDALIRLQFTETDSCTIFFDTTNPSIDNLMVSRPCGDKRLFQCIFQVMKLGNFVLFEPGIDRFIVLREEVIAHLPEGMAEALGEARIAANIESFIEAYEKPVTWDGTREVWCIRNQGQIHN
ncbi:MAG: hypothetical protein ACLP5H_34440 [Desulfomonilaceae bacterium]